MLNTLADVRFAFGISGIVLCLIGWIIIPPHKDPVSIKLPSPPGLKLPLLLIQAWNVRRISRWPLLILAISRACTASAVIGWLVFIVEYLF